VYVHVWAHMPCVCICLFFSSLFIKKIEITREIVGQYVGIIHYLTFKLNYHQNMLAGTPLFFLFPKNFSIYFAKQPLQNGSRVCPFFFFFFNRNKTIEECLIRKFGNHSGLTPGLYFCKEKPPLYQATSRTVGVS
jgi:hypothetical protein